MCVSSRSAFTLVELLVVLTVIAIIASILFPVFGHVRQKARQATCLSNQKQLTLAILSYAQDYDETFPPAEYGSGLTQTYWPFLVDSYIKGALNTSPNVGGPNKDQPKSVYVCPDYKFNTPDNAPNITTEAARRSLLSYGVNDYVCPDLKDGKVFVQPAILSKLDSPAGIVLLAESLGDNSYVQGRDDSYDNTSTSGTPWHNACYMNARTRHNGGANFAFSDGHAKWFRAPTMQMPQLETARDTTIAWVHCTNGLMSKPAGWFYPLSDTVTKPSSYSFQGKAFPSDACP